MVEIIEQIFTMMANFINSIYDFSIPFENGQLMPVGNIIVTFVGLVIIIYQAFELIGLIKGGGDDV